MNGLSKIKVISTLSIIFFLSIAVKYSNINRPLSKHHEFFTAIPLRVLQIWQEEGAAKFNYNPVMNYKGSTNKNINNNASSTGTMKDNNGNYYFVSQPQFAYIFPYFTFKIFNIKATVLSLEIFNLIINFFSAAFIYLIICLLSVQKPFKKIFIPGLIGFSIYLFSPAVLWFQTNIYMSEVLVQFPFILIVYTILKLLMRKRFYSVKYLLYYSFFLFIMIYTSWLGLFFAFSVFVYSTLKLRYERYFIPLIFITVGVSFFTLLLIFKQYSLINGPKAYIIQMLDSFSETGSFNGHDFKSFISIKLIEIKLIFYSYAVSYLPIYLLLIAFLGLLFSRPKLKFVFTKNGVRFFWLSSLPIFFLHLSFMNYSKNDFIALYGSLFLAVIIGIIYDKLKKGEFFSPYLLNGGIISTIFLSLVIYFFINKPGNYSLNGAYYAKNKDIGVFIKQDAHPNEVVYLVGKGIILDPQLIVYAERNVIKINKDEIADLPTNSDWVCYSVKANLEIEIIRNFN